jgi:hypothetical protein
MGEELESPPVSDLDYDTEDFECDEIEHTTFQPRENHVNLLSANCASSNLKPPMDMDRLPWTGVLDTSQVGTASSLPLTLHPLPSLRRKAHNLLGHANCSPNPLQGKLVILKHQVELTNKNTVNKKLPTRKLQPQLPLLSQWQVSVASLKKSEKEVSQYHTYCLFSSGSTLLPRVLATFSTCCIVWEERMQFWPKTAQRSKFFLFDGKAIRANSVFFAVQIFQYTTFILIC